MEEIWLCSTGPWPPPSDQRVRYLRVERVVIICVIIVVTGGRWEWQRSRMGDLSGGCCPNSGPGVQPAPPPPRTTPALPS